MVELTEEGRAVIEALIQAPVAWRSPGELASMIGQDLEETTDLLAWMDAGGWLAAWERPDDLVVTLSVEAASRLEVRLVEIGPNQTLRWARRSLPEPPQLKASGVFRGGRAASLELVIDDRPIPSEVDPCPLIMPPTPGKPRDAILADSLPRPTILVGTGLSPWPGPGDGRKASCPACRSRKLRPSMYCLCCDRWGFDHVLREEPLPRPVHRIDPERDVRLTERARDARKAKRQARRIAQIQADQQFRRRRRISGQL